MKSSGSAGKAPRPDQCVIVDGYNVIGRRMRGALKSVDDLESARAWLLEQAAEYRAFTGDDVILVYDAHHQDLTESREMTLGVTVIYTHKQETADERIERLVYELRGQYRQIIVATSDAAEQQVVFGGGALRISAAAWLRRMASVQRQIERTVEGLDGAADRQKGRLSDYLRQDIEKILEKWRRQ